MLSKRLMTTYRNTCALEELAGSQNVTWLCVSASQLAIRVISAAEHLSGVVDQAAVLSAELDGRYLVFAHVLVQCGYTGARDDLYWERNVRA